MPKTHLTPQELAERWQVTPQCVRRWLRDGKLPAVRLSRAKILVPIAAVEAFEQTQTVTGA